MTPDEIVENLRTKYKVMCRRCQHFNCDMTAPHHTMGEAADYIEWLHGQLAEFQEYVRHKPFCELRMEQGLGPCNCGLTYTIAEFDKGFNEEPT